MHTNNVKYRYADRYNVGVIIYINIKEIGFLLILYNIVIKETYFLSMYIFTISKLK